MDKAEYYITSVMASGVCNQEQLRNPQHLRNFRPNLQMDVLTEGRSEI